MRVLLVEDSNEKAEQVCTSLERALAPEHLHLDRAQSFLGAIRSLESASYDLLVLDLLIPVRDGELPDMKGGGNVLAEVVSGGDCIRPSHIICLTAFDDAATALRSEEEKSLVHIVLYNETDSSWRDALEAKAKYVEARLREAEARPRDYKVDVAIVTSSPLVELREIRRLPGEFTGEHNRDDVLDYYSTTWKTVENRELSIVACAAPQMGMTAACVTACKVIERWRPRFLVMTGIAAATRSEQQFGDVLVASSAYDYGSGKITEVDGRRHFLPSPHPLNIDPDLHAILQRWEQEQRRMSVVQRAWHAEVRTTPRLVLGVLASGAAVVQNEKVMQEILNSSRKVVGLDMEAYAIFQAAHLARAPQPRVLVAKSVSDFANSQKDDGWQQYAAFTSAYFVYEFFTHSVELQLGH